MSKSPAFQNYAADYYMDTNDWTIEEIGIYQRLLLTQWVNVDLPPEPERLARIAGCSLKKFLKHFPKVSKKFSTLGSGRIQNKRLEETRIEQEQFHEKAIKSGKFGAEIRWKAHVKNDSKPIRNPNSKNIALQSSSSSSSLKDKKNKKQKPIILSESQFGYFNLFYDAYPKHEGKEDAKKAWSEIDPEPNDTFLEKVLNTIHAFMPKWAEDDYKFVPLPATWLRAKRWNDEIVVPVNGHQRITDVTKFAKGPAEWLRMRKQARGEL